MIQQQDGRAIISADAREGLNLLGVDAPDLAGAELQVWCQRQHDKQRSGVLKALLGTIILELVEARQVAGTATLQ